MGAVSDGSSAELIAIGLIRKPLGLSGQCAVSVFGRTLEEMKSPQKISAGKTPGDTRTLVITAVTPGPRGCACSFQDCSTREQAESLRDLYLFVERDRLRALEPEQYHGFELVGMNVESIDGGSIGTVVDVLSYPTVDAIEVGRIGRPSVTIPLESATIAWIDREKKSIGVRPDVLEELL